MTKVKFGDVVVRANTKEDKDNTNKIYYVGGEHIESDTVVVRNRGIIEGSGIGPMFYFGFKSGDVLFVSRNPHLRKAGMVFFDGICSEKTFVLETANPEVLYQKYLPFIMQTDDFWSYLEENKSGSVNFFTNWSTLEKYEFNLPPLNEQIKLANVLWSIIDTQEAYKRLLKQTDELVKSQFIEMFGNPLRNEMHWPVKKMKTVASAKPYPGEIPSINGKYWLLNLDAVESQTGEIIERVFVPLDELSSSITTFSPDNVLYSKLRPYLNKVVIPDNYGYATTEMVPLFPDKKCLHPVFLSYFLKGDIFVSFITKHSSGTKMPRVNMDEFWNVDLILPPLELQEEFSYLVQQSDKSKFELKKTIESLEALYKSIIAEYLG